MSTRIIFLATFFLPFFAKAQIDNAVLKLLNTRESLYVDSSIIYATDTNKRNQAFQPHGVWRQNSNFKSITSYFDGRLHGHAIVFFPNGNIATSSYNYYNEPHGPFLSFWPDGSPHLIKFYEKGKLNGVYKEFDSSGVFKRIIEFKDDKKDGLEIIFYPSGNIESVATYKADKLIGVLTKYKDNDKFEVISVSK